MLNVTQTEELIKHMDYDSSDKQSEPDPEYFMVGIGVQQIF